MRRASPSPCELARAGGRLDLVQTHDPAFDLRNRLLRDDEDVLISQLGSFHDQACEVVSFAELGEPAHGGDRQVGHSPRIWSPA